MHLQVEWIVLGEVSDSFSEGRSGLGYILASNEYLAFIRLEIAHAEFHEGGLAGAVRTEQPRDPAAVNFQRYAIDSILCTVPFGDILEGNEHGRKLRCTKFAAMAKSNQAEKKEVHPGLVLRSTGALYDVLVDNGDVVVCRIRGKFRLEKFRTTSPIAVGDRVMWSEVEDEGTGMIEKIVPRRNRIIRRSVNLSHEAHVVAANVDRAWLMVTLTEPSTSTGFVDRFLVTAEAYGVPTTLLFNKIDVLALQGEEALELLEMWMATYRAIGYECVAISAKTGSGLEAVHDAMLGGVHLVSGHSGVGKSTMLNALIPGLDIRTSEVSDSHGKGRHTTTHAEMHRLPGGGLIIDTPGIKGFGLVRLEKETLHHHFPEMFALLPECKFHNCRHLTEPGCAVLQAVETGGVDEVRHKNYLQMVEEFEEGPYR